MPTYIWSTGAVRNVRVLEGDAEQRISDELIIRWNCIGLYMRS